MSGELRGNSREGYRGQVECPHCMKVVHLSAMADIPRKVILVYPVNREGHYTPADMASLEHARVHGEATAGLPQAPGRVRLPSDPVPAFDGERGT